MTRRKFAGVVNGILSSKVIPLSIYVSKKDGKLDVFLMRVVVRLE